MKIIVITIAVGLAIGLASSIHARVNGIPNNGNVFREIRWREWAAMSIVAFIGLALSLINLLVAANLGYDGSPDGEAIIARWRWGLLITGALFAVCATRAIISWRKRA